MANVKSHRQIWGMDFPHGSEWDAGVTPPNASLPQQGRWTVRREVDRFVVFFFCFNTKRDTLLTEFLPTEQGEIDAKIFALVALDNLWIYSQEVIV